MKTWIGVHLPQACLETHYPQWRTKPAAVLRNARVAAVSPAAHEAGVRVGMRQGSATALCPESSLLAYDARAEARAADAAALALLQYTPELAQTEGNTLLMDVTASLALFGGPRTLYRRIRATMSRLGFTCRIAMAPTAAGARLLAAHTRNRRRRVLKPASLARLLDALACASLPQAQPHLDWLDGIGCATLANLRRLPRPGLQRRTSKALLQALDAAYGQTPELFHWVIPPLEFSGRVELALHIEHAQAVLAAASRLIEQLCGWLAAHRRAVTRAELFLEHERGRHARPATKVEISLGAPSWQAEHLLRILDERLHRLELAAPVIAMALDATNTQPMEPASHDLFPEPGGSPAERQRLIELLAARLGYRNLLRASPAADHRPETANRWVCAGEKPSKAPRAQAPERPLWLLDEPIVLATKGHRPFYGSPLYVVSGPERIEDGWWAGLVVRDYFVARTREGARYWLFQNRGDPGRWFLHGLFG